MIKTLAVCFVLLIPACQVDQELVSNLSETEANEVLVVLDSQKIKASKTLIPAKTGNKAAVYSIQVPGSKASDALRILVDNKLPKPKSPGLGEVYPSDASSLIPSKTEERAKFLRAIQGEVENMLKVLPGIIEARVIIVQPEQDVIRDLQAQAPSATASVAVVYNPVEPSNTPPVKPEEIKYLVASAVEGLTPSRVTVLMSHNLATAHKNSPRLLKPMPKAPASNTLLVRLREEVLKEDSLMLFFGALAILGVLLGAFGIIRNRSLRAQLSNALESHENTHVNKA